MEAYVDTQDFRQHSHPKRTRSSLGDEPLRRFAAKSTLSILGSGPDR